MEHWYAIYSRPRHEKKVFERLQEKEIEAFLPMVRQVRQWKDRKKKVDEPLFKSYLFACFDYKYRHLILQTDGVVKIVSFFGEPAIVPDWQIESLKNLIQTPEKMRLEQYLKPGELVEVMAGPFKGMKGTVKSLRGETRLVLSIEGIMQSVSVEIDQDILQKQKVAP
jgi:transcription elongation factor/antiterminator RfaH